MCVFLAVEIVAPTHSDVNVRSVGQCELRFIAPAHIQVFKSLGYQVMRLHQGLLAGVFSEDELFHIETILTKLSSQNSLFPFALSVYSQCEKIPELTVGGENPR